MRLPAKLDTRKRLTFEGIDDVAVPVEDIHTEVATLTHQGIEERTKLVGVSAGRLVGSQPRPAVNIPGYDEDRALGLLDSLGKGGKVSRGVNEERGARRRRDAPAVSSWYGYLTGGGERHPLGGGLTHRLPSLVVRARADLLPHIPRHGSLTIRLTHR